MTLLPEWAILSALWGTPSCVARGDLIEGRWRERQVGTGELRAQEFKYLAGIGSTYLEHPVPSLLQSVCLMLTRAELNRTKVDRGC